MKRRHLLGVAIPASVSGCLRLEGGDDGTAATTVSESEPSESNPDSETTRPGDSKETTSDDTDGTQETTAATGCRLTVTFDFDDARTYEGSDRTLAFACYEISVLDASGSEIARYNIGQPDEEPQFLEGAYSPAPEEDYRNGNSFRWFGTETKRTTLLLDPIPSASTPALLTFEGDAVTLEDGQVTATVSIGGETASELDLTATARNYSVDVPDDPTCGL